MDVADRDPAGIRPHHDPGEDVAQDQRLLEPLGDEGPDQGGNHDDDDVGSYPHAGSGDSPLAGRQQGQHLPYRLIKPHQNSPGHDRVADAQLLDGA